MQVADSFGSRFGAPPAGVWSAPGRVNLVGEHTDYNQGLCLPIALPQRTYAAASARGDRRLRVWSAQVGEVGEVDLDEVGPGRPAGWAAYVAGVVWALAAGGHPVAGLDLAIDGQVPLGAGLSSSAALSCAVGAACSDLFGLGLLGTDEGRAELAAACVRGENEVAQAPTGGMDQAASLRSRAGHALLLDCRDGSVEHVRFDLAGHGLALLVMDTRAEHALVDGQYAARRQACEEAARRLGLASLREVPVADLDGALDRLGDEVLRRRTRHVVTEIDRVTRTVQQLRQDEFAEVGTLFDASHESLRDDFEVSCPELDLAVTEARRQGALGARMTGGGFGGSAIALAPVSAVETITAAVEHAFADAGFHAPQCFPVVAGPPADRDR
ncbi:MAG TPA: galactokinase [Dermatophilaceae bacterium]|nr:galactokinase [Dermatophilaceae bacterium]